uniref:Polycystic kidney disease protein 1-like 2 isoform X1 n=1 Tax=Petromyzon marinus TaxID=7757 RepID=A0AAJ7WWD8_PETMA|nr:polycystic kidney disease protein 1-like 2 isoform X1 [Petromyzon marinus]
MTTIGVFVILALASLIHNFQPAEGAIFTLTTMQGTIFNPNYPNVAPSPDINIWTIQAPLGNIITLTVDVTSLATVDAIFIYEDVSYSTSINTRYFTFMSMSNVLNMQLLTPVPMMSNAIFMANYSITMYPDEYKRPIGLESGIIPDNALSASSAYGTHKAWHARLHNPVDYWSPLYYTNFEYIIIDFQTIINVTGLIFQGSVPAQDTLNGAIPSWVNVCNMYIKDPATLNWSFNFLSVITGNTDSDTATSTFFSHYFFSAGLKIVPQKWHMYPSLRIEILSSCTKANRNELSVKQVGVTRNVEFTLKNVFFCVACYLWDVGDGNIYIIGPSYCTNLLKMNVPTYEYYTDPIVYTYTYPAYGTYPVVVHEISEYGNNTSAQVLTINQYGCTPYSVTFTDDLLSTNKQRLLLISEAINFLATVNMTCLVQYDYINYIWSIKDLQTGNFQTVPWYGPKRQHFEPLYFTEGTFLIEVTANIAPLNLMNMTDNFTLIVQPTPLEVYITGGDTRTISNGADVEVDASELSYDPDDVSQSNTGMVFQWKCTKTSQNNVKANCKFSELDNGIISIPQSELEINAVILAEVTATKGKRIANRTQALQIKGGSFLDIAIRCIDNCDRKFTSPMPLVLLVNCVNCFDDVITYHWKMVNLSDVYFIKMTSTGIYNEGIVVNEHALKEGNTFEINVTGTVPNRNMAEVMYRFTTSLYPSNGSCTSDPPTGLAGVTFFKLTCGNWSQKGIGRNNLSYSYTAKSGNVDYYLLNTKSDMSPKLLLPAGDLDSQGLLDLQVIVCNPYGSCSSFPIPVHVTSPPPNQLKDNIHKMLAPGGAIQEMANTSSGTLLGVILTATETLKNVVNKTERKELIAELAKAILSSNFSMQNESSVLQYALSLTSMAQNSQPEDQAVFLNAEIYFLKKINSMKNIGKIALRQTIEAMVRISANAFQAHFNSQDDVNSTLSSLAKNDSYLKKSFDDIYQSLLLIAQIQSKKSVPIEEPVALSFKNVSIVMQTVSGTTLLNASWQTTDGSSASLIVHDPLTFIRQRGRVNVMVTAFGENPFVWNKDSPVNSSVVSFKISMAKQVINTTSALIKLKNKITVGHKISLPINTKNGTMESKAFATESSSMPIMLDITSTSEIMNEAEIVVRFGKQPESDPQLYDYRFTASSQSSNSGKLRKLKKRAIDAKQKNNTETTLLTWPSFFIARNSTQQGALYIAVLYTGRNYTLINQTVEVTIRQISCKWRYSTSDNWNSSFTEVESNSRREVTSCVVGRNQTDGHLDFIQENVFVAAEFLTPNMIDFTTVFTKFNLETNGAVFATVTIMVLLYIIVLLWARNQDARDARKSKVIYIEDVNEDYTSLLLLRMATATTNDAKVVSSVYFNLYFDDIELGERQLTHPQLEAYESGIIYNFIFSKPECCGKPTHIKLWLNGDNVGDSWNIRKMSLFDQENQEVYFFGDNSIPLLPFDINCSCKTFKVQEDIALFSNTWMANRAIKSNFSEDHLWMSVFIRPFKTNFSRVHRISCCVTLLFLMMMANAMWFGKKQAASKAGGGVAVGPLSLTDVLISLLSSLVEVPVSLVVVLIFRNSRSESERPPGQKSSWRGPWPGGCRCVAWCLVVLAVLSSGFFTILYSMEWGPEKANRWLIRFLLSFIMSIALIQPIKNVLSAVVKYILWKKVTRFLNTEVLKSYLEVLGAGQTNTTKGTSIQSPARIIFGQTLQRILSIKLFLNVLQLIALFFAAYTHMNGFHIHFKTNVQNIFITGKYENIDDAPSYWDWMFGSLLPNMKQSVNNVKTANIFLSNMHSPEMVLVGSVWLRQLRYTKGPIEMKYVNMLQDVKHSPPVVDIKNYAEAWVPSNTTGGDYRDKYWIFQNMPDEDASSTFESLRSDGYLVELVNDAAKAADTLTYLKENSWLDSRTSALVTELTVFNANTNLLCHMNLLLVFSLPGIAHPQFHLKVSPLQEIGNAWFVVNMAAYIIILVLGLLLMVCEIFKMKGEKMSYFGKIINYVELLCFVLRITLVVIYFFLTMTLKENLYLHTQGKHTQCNSLPQSNPHMIKETFNVHFFNLKLVTSSI